VVIKFLKFLNFQYLETEFELAREFNSNIKIEKKHAGKSFCRPKMIKTTK
jgi:hypothetical protein